MLGTFGCELTHHAWSKSLRINPPCLVPIVHLHVSCTAFWNYPTMLGTGVRSRDQAWGGYFFSIEVCLPPRRKHGELGTECRGNFKLTHAAWHQSAVRAARGAMEPSQGGQGGQAKEAKEAKEGKGRSHAPQAPRKPQCAPRATEALQAARAPRAPRVPSAPDAPRASTRPTQTTRILRAPCAACATRTPHAACDLCAFPAL